MRNVHSVPARCGLRAGSCPDDGGTSRSLSALAILAALAPAMRCVKIHVTQADGGAAVTWPFAGSGGSFAKLNWNTAQTLNDGAPLSVDGLWRRPTVVRDAGDQPSAVDLEEGDDVRAPVA